MQIVTRLNKVIAYSEHGYVPVGHSVVCSRTGECHENALVVTVDCVPTDIDSYEYYYLNGKFVKDCAKTTETSYDVKVFNTKFEHVCTLHHSVRGDVARLYGDLPLPIIKNDEGKLYIAFKVGDANAHITGCPEEWYSPQCYTLYIGESELWVDGVVSTALHAIPDGSAINIYGLPMPDDTTECVIHVNMVYDVSSAARTV